MSGMEIVSLVMRWLHILSAITLMGGSIFMRFALLPAASELPDEQHAQLKKGVLGRWKMFVMASIGLLLLSGLVNFGITVAQYKMPPLYHPLFGIKFLLALPIFFIASLLTGRTALAEKVRQNAKFWLTVNLLLAVAVVLIGGTLRSQSFERKPKAVVTTSAAEVSRSVVE
jgi:uncharacterized membrane protein